MRCALVASLIVLGGLLRLQVSATSAQGGRWKAIGRTVAGNRCKRPQEREARGRHRDGNTSGRVRETGGVFISSHTTAPVDCARRSVAVIENTYWFDEKANRIYDHSAPKLPGYSSIIKRSLPDVAHTYLCAVKLLRTLPGAARRQLHGLGLDHHRRSESRECRAPTVQAARRGSIARRAVSKPHTRG
jgi:hypothetical protein